MSISPQQEKSSNFSQTSDLLNQYLKEKGNFGDLSLGMTRNVEGRTESFRSTQITTMNLSPMMEMSTPISGRNASSLWSARHEVKSMDLFPQHAGFGPSTSMASLSKKADFSPPNEPESAPMTIFYAGKVIIFDDFPAENAKKVMLLASKGSSPNSTSSLFTSTSANDIVSDTISTFQNNSYQQIASNFAATIASANKKILPSRPHQPIVTDLPIARKASLHRFMEKRKDRITSKAPYQFTNSVSATAVGKTSPASKTWLGLAFQSTQPFLLASQSSRQLGFQL